MNKGKIYTLLVFSISLAVVFGGWFLTKELLSFQEMEILSVKGQVSMESFRETAKEDKEESASAVQEEFVPQILSEDMMAEVLTVWDAGGRERLHEPIAGQMNMEQAIKAGREWIDTLAENHILPADLKEDQFSDTSAVLSTLDSQASLEESLISYWKITYAENDVTIILIIHAASGQIWKADISMSEEKMLFGTCTDEELLAIAFPFLVGENEKIMVEEGDGIYKIYENGKVFAALKRDGIVVNKQEPVARLFLSLETDI